MHTATVDLGEKEKVGDVRIEEQQVEYAPPGEESREEQEKRLVRRLDKRIMPMICAMYLFAYLDRTNLGNARLQGFPRDTLHGDPTGMLFDWVNSAFFFSYVLCQMPAILLSKLCPPRFWLGSVAIGWGLCSALMSTGFNFPGVIVARIGLGVFEAGFSPGFPLYLSLFYTREEIGLRTAYWFGFAAIAGAFSGLIAFGIQHVHVAAVANWRLLFVVEGVPTVLLGVCAMFVLPNRPEETKIFDEREREIALERMNRGCRADKGRMLQTKHIAASFKDWKLYAVSVAYFAANCGTGGITAFLPTIIETFGFTDAAAQLLTVPPYAAAACVLCLMAYASDRFQNRGLFTAASCCVAGVGYVLLLTVTSNNVRYFATFCTTIGVYGTIGLVLAWFSHNLGSETKKAAGIPLYMAIGHCGSILGSHLFPLTDGPRYIKGFGVTCALQFLGAVFAIVLTVYYRTENRRRDQKYGVPIPNAPVDTSQLADEAPDFRYTP
ncbi:MFS general substrate transporter [Daedaleopsis nitida]|nr:MFS general substrate transporter [Daedaleopsis nitida]